MIIAAAQRARHPSSEPHAETGRSSATQTIGAVRLRNADGRARLPHLVSGASDILSPSRRVSAEPERAWGSQIKLRSEGVRYGYAYPPLTH